MKALNTGGWYENEGAWHWRPWSGNPYANDCPSLIPISHIAATRGLAKGKAAPPDQAVLCTRCAGAWLEHERKQALVATARANAETLEWLRGQAELVTGAVKR